MPTTTFSMRIDTELKTALEHQAKLEDRSTSYIAQRAIEEWARRQEAVRASIREAIELDDGRRISEEAMDAWLEKWGNGEDVPLPEPDIFEEPFKLKKSA
jgi:predicted transcriptional regulator